MREIYNACKIFIKQHLKLNMHSNNTIIDMEQKSKIKCISTDMIRMGLTSYHMLEKILGELWRYQCTELILLFCLIYTY